MAICGTWKGRTLEVGIGSMPGLGCSRGSNGRVTLQGAYSAPEQVMIISIAVMPIAMLIVPARPERPWSPPHQSV